MLPSFLNVVTLTAVVQIAAIWLGMLMVRAFLRLAAHQTERRLEKTTASSDRLARLKTLLQAGRNLLQILLLLAAGLMTLRALGIDITPVLAGAGVVGLAISLGAQTLIRDVIGGIVILIENHFTVGDVIQSGTVTGTVERINLRATTLRSSAGQIYVIPNGELRVVSNYTYDWAKAVVDVNVAFDSDFGQVVRALESAAQVVAADVVLKTALLDVPRAEGWVGLNEWAVQMRLSARTQPGRQWEVEAGLRRAALEALQAAHIRVAVPAQAVRLEGGEAG
jgi:small conductance mechanosensitive channel